jgi:TRAP-type C4-dicarboxylate transport system permease small subunit
VNERKPNDTGRQKSVNMAALRAAVAAYLIYLGWSLIWDRLNGKDSLTPVLAWLAGLAFLLGGAAYGWYTWRRWRRERSAAADSGGSAGEEP